MRPRTKSKAPSPLYTVSLGQLVSSPSRCWTLLELMQRLCGERYTAAAITIWNVFGEFEEEQEKTRAALAAVAVLFTYLSTSTGRSKQHRSGHCARQSPR